MEKIKMTKKYPYNPYDFANPISREDLFVGREKELIDIKYYLDQAKNAPKAINLAFLGDRASGKTSLLNITEIIAKRKGFCSARINLDESDARNQLDFFMRIFDNLTSSIADMNAFGGLNGKTYYTFRDMVDSFEIPEKKTFCPFLFPIQYAKAKSKNNFSAQVSDISFKRDLETISEEIKKPIILLFDECDVLEKCRIHLQKLRNIFMSLSGYLLVFSGTNNLFPIMDEVFSPIIRQFKKIPVVGFKDKDETKKCIIEPLKSIGIKNFQEIIDFETYFDVDKIHKLSGGVPYEIQLICHKMFRKIQIGASDKMKLDYSILEDVKKELENNQNIDERPIISNILKLENNELKLLSKLISCDNHSTFEELYYCSVIFENHYDVNIEKFKPIFDKFLKNNIICKNENNKIYFNGDEFDKIYIKYYGKEKNIDFYFSSLPLKYFIQEKLHDFLLSDNEELGLSFFDVSGSNIDFICNLNESFKNQNDNDISPLKLNLIYQLYKISTKYRMRNKIPMLMIDLNLFDIPITQFCYSEDITSTGSLIKCKNKIKSICTILDKIKGKLHIKKLDVLALNTVNTEKIRLKFSLNKKYSNRILLFHCLELANHYICNDIENAKYHYDIIMKLKNKNIFPETLNNLGYFSLYLGDFKNAKKLLLESLQNYESEIDKALPSYNLGIVYIKLSEYKFAMDHFQQCKEQLKNLAKKDKLADCLFVPIMRNGKIELEEKKNDVNLYNECLNAIEFVKNNFK
jgi:hypothetical protein